MALWSYDFSGLSVSSDLLLPEWADFAVAPSPARPDLAIRLHPAFEETPHADWQTTSITPDEYRFFIPEVAAYRVHRLGGIEITPEPGADLRSVRAFLLGSALGAFYHLRGLPALHASAVQMGNSAVAFCGESGAGKSTLAALLNARGHTLVGDDLCRIGFSEGGRPFVHRSASRLKLWRESLAMLGREGEPFERDHARMEKFHVPSAGTSQNGRLPLSALYLPVWGGLALTRLSGLPALRRLVGAATYRGDLLEPMGRLGGYWSGCVELLQHVPLWEFSRPKDADQAEAGIAFLEAQVLENTRREA